MNCLSARKILLFATVCALLTFFLYSPAMATDELGIFWDTSYLQYEAEVPAGDLPAVRTGYLVLKNPSDPAGLLGWECLVRLDGPAQFLGWTLEGDNINVGTPPEFQVGIGGDPLPVTPDGILLATFQIYVTEYTPVTLALTPVYRPSVPDAMVFIPASDPGVLVPMGTVTGHDDVAWINGEIPIPVITPSSIHFGTIPQGQSRQEVFSIQNVGGGIIPIDASILGECPDFSLVDFQGPVYLAANQSTRITVGYTPTAVGIHTCAIDLGPTIEDPYYVTGTSREPVVSWTMREEIDFNTVYLGEDRSIGITIRNTGEVDIPVAPVLPPGTDDFAITQVPPGGTIPVNTYRIVHVTFTPTTTASYDFFLDMGSVLPDVRVFGTGAEPQMSWLLSPQSISFDNAMPGNPELRDFSITNTGQLDINLAPALQDTTLGFSIPGIPDSYLLTPGSSVIWAVWFVSPVPGEFQTALTLGGPLPDLPLQATVPLGAEPCLVTPPVLDFGIATVGVPISQDFYVTNQQPGAILVDPLASASSLTVTGGPVTLELGESAMFTATLHVLAAGPVSETIDLGNGVCGLLPVTAVAEEPSCYAEEGPLDFGIVAVGSPHHRELALQNPFPHPLTVQPVSDSPYFTVPGTPITIGIFETGSVTVTVTAPTAGLYEGTIDLGNDLCGPVTCLAEAQEGHCAVSTTLLAFGDVPVGTTAARYLHVVNDGPATLTLDPSITGTQFWTASGPQVLDPGFSTTLTIYFQPAALGSFQSTLDLGTEFCQPVSLTGTGTSVASDTNNRLGIYFDNEYSQIEWVSGGQGEQVTGYLVLTDPSDMSGVIAWECRFGLEGNAFATSWVLEGSHVNVGDQSAGEFIVGLADPLPWSPHVLLATVQILSFVGSQETALLSLSPIANPSIPGYMAWIAESDPDGLIPMVTSSEVPVVAIIVGDNPLPVEMPAPAATQTGGQVQLSWSLPQVPGDGCHVYRLDPDGREERLTAAPVAPEGKEFRFVDQPFGYPNGALLTYSYTLVTDGTEGGRSPGTEVRLSGVPAARTKLLANVPNPFNPSTEVHFQLDGTQRVHVSVYDVNGRLVRTLVDEVLNAGPHHRTWDGRDNGGRAVSSGAYYLRLVTGGSVDHRKMMLLK